MPPKHRFLCRKLGPSILLLVMLLFAAAPTTAPPPDQPLGVTAGDMVHASVTAARTGYEGAATSVSSRMMHDALGTYTIIVILVEFADMAHTFTEAQVAQVAINELDAYYEEASFNQTHITGATTSWLSLGHNREYYVQGTTYPSDSKFSLVQDAIAVADSSVNYATYDRVTIVHAGQGQELSRDWKDYWSLVWSEFSIVVDGITITSFSVSPEVGQPGELASVGVIAHEFGHFLGLPNLYATSDSGEDDVGHWCLMGKGCWNGPHGVGESPAHMMGQCKLDLGYVINSQLLEVTSANSVVVDPLENPTSGVHLVKIPTSGPYYLVEVRQQIGYDQYLPAKGVVLSYVQAIMETGYYMVTVVDSHPATPSKDDAAFDVGPGAVSSCISAAGQFSMFVENAVGDAYNITVLRAWVEFESPPDGSVILREDFSITWKGSAAAPGIDHYELFFDGSLIYSGLAVSYPLTRVAAGVHNASLVMVLAGSGFHITVQSQFVVDLAWPTILAVFNVPTAPGFGDLISVVVKVTDDTWIVNATLYYRRSGDSVWYEVSMVQYSGAVWGAVLGTFFSGVTVTYYVSVRDAGGRTQIDDNGGSYYSFGVSGFGLIIWVILIAAIVLAVLFLVVRSVQKRRRAAAERVWTPAVSRGRNHTAISTSTAQETLW